MMMHRRWHRGAVHVRRLWPPTHICIRMMHMSMGMMPGRITRMILLSTLMRWQSPSECALKSRSRRVTVQFNLWVGATNWEF